MWSDLEQKKRLLDARRPLAAASLRVLEAWYDHELTYTSNALEGNTLTRSETSLVLEKGITVRGKPLKDHMEAIGHKDALDYVHVLSVKADVLREADIWEIHRLVTGRADPGQAGRYSTVQREILGS
ncbi:MAG: hypothetical protein MRY59_13190 [Aquisalinus sp.]|nr:hypothetical protein [Aquisalinus sp.]